MRRESVVMAKTKYTRRYDVRDEIRITPPVFPPRRRRGTARSASPRGVPTARRRMRRTRRGPGNAPRRSRFRDSVDGRRRKPPSAPARAAASRRSSTSGAESLCARSSHARSTRRRVPVSRRSDPTRTSLWSRRRLWSPPRARGTGARSPSARARRRGARCAD